MNLAAGILFLWLGSACLWVAHNGLDNDVAGWSGIWQTILDGIRDNAVNAGTGATA